LGTVRQLRTLIQTFADDEGCFTEEFGHFEPDAEFAIVTVFGMPRERYKGEEPISQIALQGLPNSRVLVTMRAGRTYRITARGFTALRNLVTGNLDWWLMMPPTTAEQVEAFNNFCDSLIIRLMQLGFVEPPPKPKRPVGFKAGEADN
jgi:hypothetical protein